MKPLEIQVTGAAAPSAPAPLVSSSAAVRSPGNLARQQSLSTISWAEAMRKFCWHHKWGNLLFLAFLILSPLTIWTLEVQRVSDVRAALN